MIHEPQIKSEIGGVKKELDVNVQKLQINQELALKSQEKELIHFYNGKIDELYKGFEEEYIAKTKKFSYQGRDSSGEKGGHCETDGLDKGHLSENRKRKRESLRTEEGPQFQELRNSKIKRRAQKVG